MDAPQTETNRSAQYRLIEHKLIAAEQGELRDYVITKRELGRRGGTWKDIVNDIEKLTGETVVERTLIYWFAGDDQVNAAWPDNN